MKTFTKFCLILSIILMILGFSGIGVSLAMGLKPSQFLDLASHPGKFDSQKLETIEELEDSLNGTDDSSGAELPPLSGNPSSDADEYYEFTGRIDELDFKLALCDLKIYCHDEDFIALEAWNTENTFQCTQDGYTLRLEDNRKKLTFQNSMDYALYLRLFLPKEMLNKIYIEVGTGNVTFEQLSAENMEINCGIGELTAKSLSGKNLDIHIGVGEMEAGTVTVSDTCTIQSGTGNITLAKYDGPNLDLNCGIGDVSVTAAGKQTRYNYELNCTAGDIRLNHLLAESEEHHEEKQGLGCHIDQDHHADRTLHIQCGLGDLELNFTEED